MCAGRGSVNCLTQQKMSESITQTESFEGRVIERKLKKALNMTLVLTWEQIKCSQKIRCQIVNVSPTISGY